MHAVLHGQTGGLYYDHPEPGAVATVGEIGTVYGLATDAEGTVFAAAFTKRHTQLVTELNPDGNPTAVYRIPIDGEPELFTVIDPTAVQAFTLQDTNPRDGELGFAELEAWHGNQAEVLQRTGDPTSGAGYQEIEPTAVAKATCPRESGRPGPSRT